jgi:hypothetical protein
MCDLFERSAIFRRAGSTQIWVALVGSAGSVLRARSKLTSVRVARNSSGFARVMLTSEKPGTTEGAFLATDVFSDADTTPTAHGVLKALLSVRTPRGSLR